MSGLTLEEAKEALRGGAQFGSVYPMLGNVDGDGETLKAFFVFGEPGGKPVARVQGYTGDVCATCGSARMRRCGVCLVCDSCGSTSGGCG